MQPGQTYPEQYDALLQHKVHRVRQLFGDQVALDVFPSPVSHFRMRAEFRVWQHSDRAVFAMFDSANPKVPIEVAQYPMGSQRINQLMPCLLQQINQTPTLRYRLFQVDFLTTLSGQALVTLIYHRPLDEAWHEAACALAAQLGVHLIGRSRKQQCIISRNWVNERLIIHGQPYYYRQYENSFTQPNAQVNQAMIAWTCDQMPHSDSPGDLLELYCGNGNFTLPLARRFRRVLATEIARISVQAARLNLIQNGITQVQVQRLSSEDCAQALLQATDSGTLKTSILDTPWHDYRFSTLFVDPPRAGLDPHSLTLARSFAQMIYISCNPTTLKQNLDQLATTHRIRRLALFDQFPYTPHIEMGAVLEAV